MHHGAALDKVFFELVDFAFMFFINRVEGLLFFIDDVLHVMIAYIVIYR